MKVELLVFGICLLISYLFIGKQMKEASKVKKSLVSIGVAMIIQILLVAVFAILFFSKCYH